MSVSVCECVCVSVCVCEEGALQREWGRVGASVRSLVIGGD